MTMTKTARWMHIRQFIHTGFVMGCVLVGLCVILSITDAKLERYQLDNQETLNSISARQDKIDDYFGIYTGMEGKR